MKIENNRSMGTLCFGIKKVFAMLKATKASFINPDIVALWSDSTAVN